MKTKFILHGGRAKEDNPDNEAFFKEILNDTPANPYVLIVLFASPPERDEENFLKVAARFEHVKDEKVIYFEMARKDIFQQQVAKADVIYFGGGTTPQLLQKLKGFPNIHFSFEGKTVVGESAGANVLATYSYSKTEGGILKGLGCVPARMLPHYEGTHPKELDELPADLELVLLREHEFKVFYV